MDDEDDVVGVDKKKERGRQLNNKFDCWGRFSGMDESDPL